MEIIKITKESQIPLIGIIQFGIIDRGTNLLQVRPNTLCNLDCPFCSTDAGVNSKFHKTNYEVECSYLTQWIKEVVNYKGPDTLINIDSVGEPDSYKDLVKLISNIKKIKNVSHISMQSNGTSLTKSRINSLSKAGLNHINLSMHSLNQSKAKILSGCSWYKINKIKKSAELISKSRINLLIAPVWLPKVNDEDIIELINFAKSIKSQIGIQKYEIYKYSRKMKGIKPLSWWKFYSQLKKWEKEFNYKLIYSKEDFKIKKSKRIPQTFHKGEKIYTQIKLPGWFKNQMIGISKNRCITINNCKEKIDNIVRVKITENKNELYLAELIK